MLSAETIKQLVIGSELFTVIDCNCGYDDSLNLDSMSLIWLITELEKKFDIEIDYRDLDLDHFDSINSIRLYVASRLSVVET